MKHKRHWLIFICGFTCGFFSLTLLPSERLSITGSGQVIANMSYTDEGYVQHLLTLEEAVTLKKEEIRLLQNKYKQLESKKPYVIVNSSKNELRLVKDGITIRNANCSTGSYVLLKATGDREWLFRTPKGKFKVSVKLKNPWWYKPDWAYLEEDLPIPSIYSPKRYVPNVLGDHALGFGDGYLVHGTLYKRFLGLPVTHGCIRLGDEDMKVVFNTLTHGSKIYVY